MTTTLNTNYLSAQLSAFDNYALIAEKNILTTEAYTAKSEEIDQHAYPAKIRALDIATVAFSALTIYAFTISAMPTLILGTLTITAFCGSQYCRKHQALLGDQLQEKAQQISYIYLQIFNLLKHHREAKGEKLIQAIGKCDREYQVNDNLAKYIKLYDDPEDHFFNSCKELREEHAKLRKLAQKILIKGFLGNWKLLYTYSAKLLYGDGACNWDYDTIDKNATYLKIVNHSGKWEAVKYY